VIVVIVAFVVSDRASVSERLGLSASPAEAGRYEVRL